MTDGRRLRRRLRPLFYWLAFVAVFGTTCSLLAEHACRKEKAADHQRCVDDFYSDWSVEP